ncbi:7893_t:CDS:2 [Funneliformis mosseae]|uniref:7893_t:CDS:1 n=1 Tax=Funneliformis mosseae TaxID=27381 RepID=A0A9N8UZD3_FUNMO|nr:7893_t:CDS:2 [Funneliformis mosseae]
MINGPGDLRRSQPDYTNAANNGPLSSQQQQISQNLSMKSKSSNRNYQQQPEGPGDARRLSNSPNMFSSPPPISSQVQYQSPQGGYQQVQGQMNPQNLVLTQGRISPRQITASPSHTPSNNINNNNLNDLNRSDTQRTTSSNTSNNSLGIQLDVNGRVKQDDLAEAFIANGGRLPPESAKFQTRPQGIPQGGQMSPQGQPIFQYNSFNRPLQQMPTNPSVITSQSSYNGPHQQLQQQSHPQVHRSNTVNSGSTLNNAFPYKQPQQGVNVNSQLPQGSIGRPQGSIGRPQGSIGRPPHRRTLPVGIQQSQSQPQIQPTQLLQQTIGTQVLGHPQTHYQNPNFYSPPVSGYPRPPIGSANIGGSAQGFQQMQYQRQPLPGSDIPDSSGSQNHPRTEDGKPIEFYVKALYDYQKTIPEEMSFTTGDVIAVISTHSDGWWEGEIVDDSRKNRGLFPSNYTKVLE